MWWIRRPRAKYSPLPLANGADEVLRGLDPRKYLSTTFYIAVFAIILFAASLAHYTVRRLEFDPIPSIRPPKSFEIRRRPLGGLGATHHNVSAISDAQETAFRFTSRPNIGCQLKPWHEARYADLRASSPEPKTILLALNLVDAVSILPSLLVEIPVLLKFLGPRNVHVSVYESGSGDFTPELLVSRKFLSTFSMPGVAALLNTVIVVPPSCPYT
jgi:hypothetical protein